MTTKLFEAMVAARRRADSTVVREEPRRLSRLARKLKGDNPRRVVEEVVIVYQSGKRAREIRTGSISED